MYSHIRTELQHFLSIEKNHRNASNPGFRVDRPIYHTQPYVLLALDHRTNNNTVGVPAPICLSTYVRASLQASQYDRVREKMGNRHHFPTLLI